MTCVRKLRHRIDDSVCERRTDVTIDGDGGGGDSCRGFRAETRGRSSRTPCSGHPCDDAFRRRSRVASPIARHAVFTLVSQLVRSVKTTDARPKIDGRGDDRDRSTRRDGEHLHNHAVCAFAHIRQIRVARSDLERLSAHHLAIRIHAGGAAFTRRHLDNYFAAPLRQVYSTDRYASPHAREERRAANASLMRATSLRRASSGRGV